MVIQLMTTTSTQAASPVKNMTSSARKNQITNLLSIVAWHDASCVPLELATTLSYGKELARAGKPAAHLLEQAGVSLGHGGMLQQAQLSGKALQACTCGG